MFVYICHICKCVNFLFIIHTCVAIYVRCSILSARIDRYTTQLCARICDASRLNGIFKSTFTHIDFEVFFNGGALHAQRIYGERYLIEYYAAMYALKKYTLFNVAQIAF